MDALHTIYMSRLLFSLYIGLKPDTHILINLIILNNMHFLQQKIYRYGQTQYCTILSQESLHLHMHQFIQSYRVMGACFLMLVILYDDLDIAKPRNK